MRERIVSSKPMNCSSSHCNSGSCHVFYDEAGKTFCFNCAFGYGGIDKYEHYEDSKEDEILSEILKNKGKGV